MNDRDWKADLESLNWKASWREHDLKSEREREDEGGFCACGISLLEDLGRILSFEVCLKLLG